MTRILIVSVLDVDPDLDDVDAAIAAACDHAAYGNPSRILVVDSPTHVEALLELVLELHT